MVVKAKAPKPAAAMRPWLRLVPRPSETASMLPRVYMPGKDRPVLLDSQVTATPVEMALGEAATVAIHVAAPIEMPSATGAAFSTLDALDANEDLLLDGVDVRWAGVWWRLARIDREPTGWVLTCEDRVAGYLRSHRRSVRGSRAKMTRAQFVYQLARGVKAGGGIRCFIPELNDKQQITKPVYPEVKDSAKAADPLLSSDAGWGSAASKVTVKGTKADYGQLRVLSQMLTEAQRLGCARRVMMAVVMAVTQESVAGKLKVSSTGQHFGPLHQSKAWGGSPGRDGTGAARAFLTLDRGPGVQGWRKVHGSLKNGSGDLGQMVDKVQIAGTPSAFGQWEREAGKTVDLWLDRNPGTGASSGDDAASQKDSYYRAEYAFRTSDEAGEARNWWEATGALAEEVSWHRWAANNTLGYASDQELIRGSPALWLSQARQEVLEMNWSWDYRRQASELTARVAVRSAFALLPGMAAMVDDERPVSGRWIIERVRVDPTEGLIAEVELRRRGARSLEPAPELKLKKDDDSKGTIGGKDDYGVFSDAKPNASGLVYPLASHGKSLGGVAAHNARAWGNWQSDNAVDIGVPMGVEVRAVADGTVTKLGGRWNGGSGNPDGWNVTMRTADNQWFYTHLKSRSTGLKVGGTVKAGQVLGKSGAANGVKHLHIACEKGDPEAMLKV